LHLVSATQDDPVAAYREVRKEIEAFGRGLEKKREIVVLSKIDLIDPAERETKIELLARETGRTVHGVTTQDTGSIKEFSDWLVALFRAKGA
jgi:GTP-binding protein